MSELRLHVLLAQAGIGSRRACERLIRDGRVSVNGQPVTKLGTRVDPARDHVKVGSRLVRRPQVHRYLLLNKPRGVVSTASDPQGRPTVIDLVAGVRERLHPVGRLDLQTEGLIVLTNDGALTRKLTHPSSAVPRVYRAKVRGELSDESRARLAEGVRLEGKTVGPIAARTIRSSGNASWVEVVVREGRKHLVRDALAVLGHPVVKLRRTAFGPLELGSLAPGEFRELTADEVRALEAFGTGRPVSSAARPGRHRRRRVSPTSRTSPARRPTAGRRAVREPEA